MSTALSIRREIALAEESCIACGLTFAVPADWLASVKRNGGVLKCPNAACNGRWWHGEGEAEKLRKRLVAATEMTAVAQRRADFEAVARRAAEVERDKALAAKDRHAKRVANGVCPCCNRSFQNLRRHMAAKHPESAA